MRELKGKQVVLQDNDLKRREEANRRYLMKLTNDNLLFNYKVEAGRYDGRDIPEDAHGGWETPVCQIRGHFLGHWLSAAAIRYHETGDLELKLKADLILDELAECQKDNGGQWAAPIPEKYLHWVAQGKAIWAPQYNIHKLFMGLVDMHQFTGSHQALDIADRFADWFVAWSTTFTREKFDDILDMETGGMLEAWADLLELTGNDKYTVLLERYYRSRLFRPLLENKDPLTNMHANTTIPEVLGCARAYEVTGEQRWMDIVTAYWKCAVTERGTPTKRCASACASRSSRAAAPAPRRKRWRARSRGFRKLQYGPIVARWSRPTACRSAKHCGRNGPTASKPFSRKAPAALRALQPARVATAILPGSDRFFGRSCTWPKSFTSVMAASRASR